MRRFLCFTIYFIGAAIFLLYLEPPDYIYASSYESWLQCRKECSKSFNESIQNECKPLPNIPPVYEQSKCIRDVNERWGQCKVDCERFRELNVPKTFSHFGGRITYTSQCVIEDPVFEPDICHTCLMCTSLLGSACANVTEIQFTPVPNTKWKYICPQKNFRYKGGGYPRIGGWILGNGYAQFIFLQIGASR